MSPEVVYHVNWVREDCDEHGVTSDGRRAQKGMRGLSRQLCGCTVSGLCLQLVGPGLEREEKVTACLLEGGVNPPELLDFGWSWGLLVTKCHY